MTRKGYRSVSPEGRVLEDFVREATTPGNTLHGLVSDEVVAAVREFLEAEARFGVAISEIAAPAGEGEDPSPVPSPVGRGPDGPGMPVTAGMRDLLEIAGHLGFLLTVGVPWTIECDRHANGGKGWVDVFVEAREGMAERMLTGPRAELPRLLHQAVEYVHGVLKPGHVSLGKMTMARIQALGHLLHSPRFNRLAWEVSGDVFMVAVRLAAEDEVVKFDTERVCENVDDFWVAIVKVSECVVQARIRKAMPPILFAAGGRMGMS